MRGRWAVGSLLLLCAAAPLAAQAPVGGEILLGPGVRPQVAGQPSGFVTLWRQAGLRGRRYTADGGAVGSEFIVSTFGSDANYGRPAIAAAADGSFVVAWEHSVAGNANVMARRFDAAGNALGPEFVVNQTLPGFQKLPSVAVAPGGAFVVAWEGNSLAVNDVFARRYDASGNALGPEFMVNTFTSSNQFEASVYAAPDGGFVALWISPVQGSGFDVIGRRYDAAGVALTPEFIVNTHLPGDQYAPAAAFDASSNFIVVWTGPGADDPLGVFARRFTAGGAPVGGEFRVTRATGGYERRPDIAAEADGRFLVVWIDVDPDTLATRLLGQLLDNDGTRLGAEFQVNTTPGGRVPAIGSDGNGRLMVAWESSGAKAQAFGGLRPTHLTVDPFGNAVAEPDEVALVAPAWLNTTGGPLPVLGTLTSFTGPAGGTYSIKDGAADYGTLADGAPGSCGFDCYTLRAAAASRPALHWDASVTEALSTGHSWTYPLHLGGSFGDVPSTNAFYRYVETLLHRGVTAGCTASTYCPATATTRDQMAVFVLVGKEGSGFAPPPCGTPVFADVPASSPFCPWVEELFRRGVVNGCGGPNYCPADAVTREQMAVFVLRTLDPALNPPACTTPVFADVPPTSPFCRWIEELVRRGIVAGCGDGHYLSLIHI